MSSKYCLTSDFHIFVIYLFLLDWCYWLVGPDINLPAQGSNPSRSCEGAPMPLSYQCVGYKKKTISYIKVTKIELMFLLSICTAIKMEDAYVVRFEVQTHWNKALLLLLFFEWSKPFPPFTKENSKVVMMMLMQ